MADIFFTLGGVLLTSSFAVGGQWIYFNPNRALDKFNPYARPHGKLSLGTIRVFGAFSVFIGVYGLYSIVTTPLGRFVSDRVHIVSILLAATITAWYLLKRERANA